MSCFPRLQSIQYSRVAHHVCVCVCLLLLLLPPPLERLLLLYLFNEYGIYIYI